MHQTQNSTFPDINQLTRRGVVEIFPERATVKVLGESELQFLSLEEKLHLAAKSNQQLRVKLGIDPTGPNIHLGHTVGLRKLRQFQDAGHKAVLIIGDFTAQIGDPTGKAEGRTRMSAEEISCNAETYLAQAKKVLDFSTEGRLEVRFNSEWLSQTNLHDVIGLLSSMTVRQMLSKDYFGNRYEQNIPIHLHEFVYPLLQGYDSVVIKADIELGGTDQKFNVLVGRDLQVMGKPALQVLPGFDNDMGLGQLNDGLDKHLPKDMRGYDGPRQFGMLLPLLVGLDGVQKMSKSLGNYVGLTDEPLSMYSKLEKVPDALVDKYFELLTDIDLATLPDNPREKQKQLALAIVGQYHSPEIASQAQQDAEKIVLAGNTTDLGDIPEFALAQINFPVPLHYLVKASGLCKSNSEAQSQVKNGAVKLDGEKLCDRTFANVAELSGKVLQVGKKKFLRLI